MARNVRQRGQEGARTAASRKAEGGLLQAVFTSVDQRPGGTCWLKDESKSAALRAREVTRRQSRRGS